MPKKPINLDRVRTPEEWRAARNYQLLSLIAGGGVGFAIVMLMDADPDDLIMNLVMPLIVVLVMAPSLIHARRVKRKWTKLIKDHGGLLCPNCAYILSGSKEEGAGVTCSECGHHIEDWKGLNERWLKKLKRFK